MRAKVSILVPIYNVEDYVDKCLTSLEKQSFKDIEIWAVSDGSPDNSAEIVKKYQAKFNNINLVEKENGGYGSVLEYCINNIQTEYFLICDPDDWLSDNCIEILYKNAEKDNLDIVVGDKYNFYGNIQQKKYKKSIPDRLDIKPNIVYTNPKVIQSFSLGEVSPHAKLYKTSLVRGIKLPHKVSYTDFVLYMVALSKAKRVEYIDKPLSYYYFDRPGNTATAIKPSIINDYLVGWDAIFNNIKNKEDYILYFRLLIQIQMILNEYARTSIDSTYNKNYEDIYKRLCLLFPLKKMILSSLPNNISSLRKILYRGLLTRQTSKLVLKTLLINDKRKFKNRITK